MKFTSYFLLFYCLLLFSCEIKGLINPNLNTLQDKTTVVIEVKSKTGKIWMDRNLGASQVATSSTDEKSYGDLYQWGRGADGHQLRTSATTTTLSITDKPGNNLFILASNYFDWRKPKNDKLWQGVNGINNPCPVGFRIPTKEEFIAESAYWTQLNSAQGAFVSPLKLPLSGCRNLNGELSFTGIYGLYWYTKTITISDTTSNNAISINDGSSGNAPRGFGMSVRCIKD